MTTCWGRPGEFLLWALEQVPFPTPDVSRDHLSRDAEQPTKPSVGPDSAEDTRP